MPEDEGPHRIMGFPATKQMALAAGVDGSGWSAGWFEYRSDGEPPFSLVVIRSGPAVRETYHLRAETEDGVRASDDPERFTPTLIQNDERSGIATMAVEVKRCPVCDRWMADVDGQDHLFPGYMPMTAVAQLKRAGWMIRSRTRVEGQPICVECVAGGKVTVACELCHERKPTSESAWSTGDPAVHLCRACYTTVPANVWHDTRTRLGEEHRYDFE